jgi:hypothetical protein
MNTGRIIWSEVPNERILAEWKKATVMKMGDFVCTDTKTREAIIDSNDKWKEFARECYLVWFDGGQWSTPNKLNWGVTEYASKNPSPLSQSVDLLILSAYHTLLEKRVIIDGCHRAVALATMVQNGQSIPTARVLECYGTQIHAILPADFCNLVVEALR